MRRTLAFAVMLMSGAPAFGAETPHPGIEDPRVKWANYDPAQVYQIVGAFRSATQILFADGEDIQHVALGDTVSWEVAPTGNILFIKPKEHAGPTNLIVSTLYQGQVRNYQFELVARAGAITAATRDTFFQVRFHYPAEDAARAARLAEAQRARQLAALEQNTVTMALDHGVIEGPRNMLYTVQGASEIQPSEVSDNGQFTVMRFPNHRELPAIFTVGPDGKEALVPYDVRDDWVVVHLIAREIRLRRGDAVLCIYNEGPATYGVDYHTNTASPEVNRTMKQEKP